MSKDDQHLTFACRFEIDDCATRLSEQRLWILHRSPHTAYCELRPATNGFEIHAFLDGAMLMSRQFASLSEAILCAQAERADLEANGWSRVDDDWS